MKTFITLSSLTLSSLLISASADAQTRQSNPQAVPMTAPAVKTQNNLNAPQQNSQAPAPKPSTGTSVETKKTENGKPAEPAPAVDNKIAVSDAGTPGDKANNKKPAASSQPETKKTAVSPK